MSSYLTIYFHDQATNNYHELGNYSRSSEIYKLFSDHGYIGQKGNGAIIRTIAPLDLDDIQTLIDYAKEDLGYYNQRVEQVKANSQRILSIEGHTISEKMEAVADNEEYLPEYQDSIEEISSVISRLSFLQDIIMLNGSPYLFNGNKICPDRTKIIYYGIDCDCPIDYVL